MKSNKFITYSVCYNPFKDINTINEIKSNITPQIETQEGNMYLISEILDNLTLNIEAESILYELKHLNITVIEIPT